MKFSDLPEQERDEVVDSVRAAYRTSTGVIRSHRAALVEFGDLLDDAEQAHRPWVGDLRSQWLRDGMRRFLQEQWKACGRPFVVVDKSGKTHERTTMRGVKRPDETGKLVWTQMEILDWYADDLKLAIVDAASQVEEQKANIGAFRRLLDLMGSTGSATVADALAETGQSLDEFLNADAATA